MFPKIDYWQMFKLLAVDTLGGFWFILVITVKTIWPAWPLFVIVVVFLGIVYYMRKIKK